jgi:hypothetical protein
VHASTDEVSEHTDAVDPAVDPASGPMDQPTARWYVQYTGGQLQTFQRDGCSYLYSPGHTAAATGVVG